MITQDPLSIIQGLATRDILFSVQSLGELCDLGIPGVIWRLITRGENARFNLEIKKKSGLSINPDIHHSKVPSSGYIRGIRLICTR